METKEKKKKKCLMEGAISAEFIAKAIGNHQSKTDIGAHAIFLEQVPAKEREGKPVSAIEFSADSEATEQEFHRIRESAFAKYNLTCLHIYQSIGKVNTGGICLFVMVSSTHRKESLESLEFITGEINRLSPLRKKEIFSDANQ